MLLSQKLTTETTVNLANSTLCHLCIVLQKILCDSSTWEMTPNSNRSNSLIPRTAPLSQPSSVFIYFRPICSRHFNLSLQEKQSLVMAWCSEAMTVWLWANIHNSRTQKPEQKMGFSHQYFNIIIYKCALPTMTYKKVFMRKACCPWHCTSWVMLDLLVCPFRMSDKFYGSN